MITTPKFTWKRALVFLLCIALLAFAQVGLSFIRNNLSSDLQKKEHQLNKLENEISRLKLELASMKRPEKLRSLARERLGMRSPMPHQVIRP